MYAVSISVQRVSGFAAMLHKSALVAACLLNACVSSTVILEIGSLFVSQSIPGKLCQMLLTRTLRQKFVRKFQNCISPDTL